MSAGTAVVPGSAFAIFILHAVMVTPCDDMLRVHQRNGLHCSVSLAKFVDDLAIPVAGVSKHVQDVALHAFDWIAERLSGELELEVSVDKGAGAARKNGNTVLVVSNGWLRAKLGTRVRGRGLRVATRVKSLGIEHKRGWA